LSRQGKSNRTEGSVSSPRRGNGCENNVEKHKREGAWEEDAYLGLGNRINHKPRGKKKRDLGSPAQP